VDDKVPRLGVDFGRVINDAASHPGGGDTVFLEGSEEDMLSSPAVAGAFQALARLNDRFDGRVWIISKCGPDVQARTERWLAHHRFFEVSGIDPGHVRFCRRRADKADHCKELQITHFVDDHPEVLAHLDGIVPHLFLFGPQRKPAASYVVETQTWEQAERAISATL
jgi:hypothetical protein